MQCIVFAVIISVVLFDGSACSFIDNDYPQFKPTKPSSDPGEPLFLTKYIESGDIQNARRLALVNHSDTDLPSYAGYFTVNKTYNSNLFFWYFPAAANVENAPVLLWLQGGPGASSLIGLFLENGPFSVTADLKLVPRKYSWHTNHHLIYIDSPVGTGFSFTDSDEGYARNQDDVARDLLSALQQFLLLFPQLQRNAFYVAGESYGGKYVPAIGYAIYKDSQRVIDDPNRPKINLQGLAIGNGFTDPINQINYADYLYQVGLVDANGHNELAEMQESVVHFINSGDYQSAFTALNRVFGLQKTDEPSLFKNLTDFDSYFNYLESQAFNTTEMLDFLQSTQTRRAIHVGNNTYHEPEIVAKILQSDIMRSVAHWVAELLSHYPIVVYNGQLDIICAYPMTVNYLEKLDFSGADAYKTAKRSIWRVGGDVAGYVKQAGNLTEVLVRNAGHLVPTDQPKWALDLILHLTYKNTVARWN